MEALQVSSAASNSNHHKWSINMTDSAVIDMTATDHSATVAKALKELASDRKAWRKMARECASGSPLPPANVLERMAPAFDLDASEAVKAFSEDAKAIKVVEESRIKLKKYEKQQSELTKTHADESTLREQLKELEEQEKDVRRLIWEHQQVLVNIAKMKYRTRTLSVTCERAFGDD